MLYLIGGAARSGKTLIAQRMLLEHSIPRYALEYFVSALHRGCPEIGVRHEEANPARAERLWPRLEPMLRNIVEVEPVYVVEGDALLPRHVVAFTQHYQQLD